ncbi:hypothetical protein I3760_04G041100 [Carya illinoinensis]|nr:hypothetical protein I3760_04G041100 [Carya illinoinensis]
MHPITFPPVFLLLFSVFVATPFPSDEATAPNFDCPKTFDCGPFKNLSYPFGNRSECGHSQFRLTCDNDFAALTVAPISYRVLRLDQNAKNMTLARSDLWNSTCPHDFFNSTLDPAVFAYGTDTEDLTIYYGCSNLTSVTPANRFHCKINGTSRNDSYFLTGPVPTDPILSDVNCSFGLREKIFKAEAVQLTNNRSTLIKVLLAGFSVSYGKCADCLVSGRQCGLDKDSGQPICLCDNHPCPSPPGKKNKVSLRVGIGIGGAGIVGIFLGFWIFSIRQRKKKRAKEATCSVNIGGCLSSNSMVCWNRDAKYDHFNAEEILRNFGSMAPKRYTYSDVKKMTNSFKYKVGQGGYGVVFKGELPDGRMVAVKVLGESKGNGEEFINEVASISRTSHVNIVTLLGFCYERTKRALIYEFVQNGSLDKFIHEKGSSITNCYLDSKTMFQIAVGIA